ncbi:hypothetical protein [Nostoc sp.]
MRCQIAKIAEGGIHPHILFLKQLIFAPDLPLHGSHHSNSPL